MTSITLGREKIDFHKIISHLKILYVYKKNPLYSGFPSYDTIAGNVILSASIIHFVS